MKQTALALSAALIALAFTAFSANAWTERNGNGNCRRSCDWKGAIISCKGPFGVPYPCHQWQKRCGEWFCHRKSY
jgi:hypothetical protein